MTENVVEDYGWSDPAGPESCGYITPQILSILRNIGAKRVIDIGAGNGALCSEIAKSGYTVVGVEYDKKGFEVARESYPGISFYNFGVQDDPSELMGVEEPFDVVVSTEVIEHLFSPHLLPIYSGGLLKQGGHLIVTTPYHGYLKNLALSLFDKWDAHHTSLWHGGHIKFWSRSTLTKLLEDHGFMVEDFSGVGRIHYLWKSMIITARKM